MFSCEFCEISKTTFFTEPFWMTASELCHQENMTIKLNDHISQNLFGEISHPYIAAFENI